MEVLNALMFEGKAEEAVKFYISLFPNSGMVYENRYGNETPGMEGKIMHAGFTLNGRQYVCMDSPIHHEFTFTPSFSFYINCASEDEVEKLYNALSEGGGVLMQLDAYPSAKKYAWINDKYGVSWQLFYNK